jgi:hypothetical protein
MTSETKKPTRQTAANNKFLADVKHWFNKPLYTKALALVNADPVVGEAEMRTYLLKNVVKTLDFLPTRGY